MCMKRALLYSGGVESTLLLYKLSQEFDINLYLVNRFNNPVDKALRLYNVIREDIQVNPPLTILDMSHLDGHLQLREARKYILEENDILYVGAIQYPNDEHVLSLLKPEYRFNFDKLRNDPQLSAPFIDMNKSETINEFYTLGIEKYLPLTHSCGNDTDNACKECFNCTERKWAYDTLGLEVDYGS